MYFARAFKIFRYLFNKHQKCWEGCYFLRFVPFILSRPWLNVEKNFLINVCARLYSYL